jgi:hypothetical protein
MANIVHEADRYTRTHQAENQKEQKYIGCCYFEGNGKAQFVSYGLVEMLQQPGCHLGNN